MHKSIKKKLYVFILQLKKSTVEDETGKANGDEIMKSLIRDYDEIFFDEIWSVTEGFQAEGLMQCEGN